MNFIKCPKCGREEPGFDYAHVCGPLEVKPKMNERIRQLIEQAGFLNKDEESIEYFAELIMKEVCQKLEDDGMVEIAMEMKQHFGVER